MPDLLRVRRDRIDLDAERACDLCGEILPTRKLTGISGAGVEETWLCGECVLAGGLDELLARAVRNLRAALRARGRHLHID